jgi:serine/threonine protein phosphatase PrpC
MFTVEVHATSHIGRVRKGNEDNYLLLNIGSRRAWTLPQDGEELIVESQSFVVNDNGIVLAVSDGMGGALAGEVASKMAVECVSEKLLEATEDIEETLTPEAAEYHLIAKLYNATLYANHLVHEHGRTDPQFQGMGATFTGIGLTAKGVDVIQLVQQLIDAQQISPEEAETHTLKNVILQALGAQNEIFPVSARLSPCRDDVLLLCSDGLSNKVSAAAIQQTITENLTSLEKAAVSLVEQANANGGEDNITVVIAKIYGDDLPLPEGDEVQLEILDLGNIHDTAEQDSDEEDTAEII